MKVQTAGHREIDCFDLLVSDSFCDLVINETNLYAVEMLSKSSVQARISCWKYLTVDEFKNFLSLLFHTGTIRLNKLEDYWKTDDLFDLQCFRKHMSRNRFLLIFHALHFGHPVENQNDRLFRIQPFLNYFNNKMDDIYYPEKNLSIDESMILWRGRSIFRQYIKGKRHKLGIKLYMLTESAGLNLRMFIYCGQKLTKIYRPHVISHTEDVVMNLMKGKLNNGHSLYMDNFYNSVDLAHKLLLKQTYYTGTLRMNRKNNPKVVTSKKLKTGEMISKYSNDGIRVFKWKDKREVLGLSTE